MQFFGGFLHRLFEYCLPGPGNSYRPHLLRRKALLLLLGVILTAEALVVGSLTLRQAGMPFLAAVIQSKLVEETNTARVREGGTVLNEHPLLTAAAYAKAVDMATKSYFAHVGPDGKEPWSWVTEFGYRYRLAGENLAVRFSDSRDVVDAWMASPTHRANIVKSGYTDIGIGIASGTYKGTPAVYVVQYFGTPAVAFGGGGAAAVTSTSFMSSLVSQMGQYITDPRSSAALVLGGIAALLLVVLGVTMLRHIQLQPLHIIAPGVAVLAVAVLLLMLNHATLAPTPGASAEALEVGVGVAVEQPPLQ